MPTLQERIEAATTLFEADAAIARAIIQGAVSDPDVSTAGGLVKTLARAIAEVGDTSLQANKDLSNVSIADFAAAADAAGVSAADILAVLTVFGTNLLSAADAPAARTLLGLVIGADVQAFDAATMKADETATLSKGFTHTSHNLGNLNAATTLSIANGNLQHGTVTGSFTLTAPNDASQGGIELELTIDATGGYTVTLSGFNEIAGAIDTTANKVNVLRMVKHASGTVYLDITQKV